MINLQNGIKYTVTKEVKETDTAIAYGTGTIKVFATPAMIALMEKTCLKCVEPFLNAGQTTVGTHINVRHLKASRVGDEVLSVCHLKESAGKKLTFAVDVYCNDILIGKGSHTRYVVEKADF